MPKVNLPSSTEWESTQSSMQSTQRIPYFERGPPIGPCSPESCRHGKWSNEGPRRRQRFFCPVPIEAEHRQKFIQLMACQVFLSGEVLYKRNHDSTLLWCVDASEANHLMEEMHEGLLGAHASGPLLAYKIMKASYYLLTMENDCIKHVRTCHRCQAYQDRKNATR